MLRDSCIKSTLICSLVNRRGLELFKLVIGAIKKWGTMILHLAYRRRTLRFCRCSSTVHVIIVFSRLKFLRNSSTHKLISSCTLNTCTFKLYFNIFQWCVLYNDKVVDCLKIGLYYLRALRVLLLLWNKLSTFGLLFFLHILKLFILSHRFNAVQFLYL